MQSQFLLLFVYGVKKKNNKKPNNNQKKTDQPTKLETKTKPKKTDNPLNLI